MLKLGSSAYLIFPYFQPRQRHAGRRARPGAGRGQLHAAWWRRGSGWAWLVLTVSRFISVQTLFGPPPPRAQPHQPSQ